ncbi:MAG: enoyl-CoA hydratase/isomerase family protein [bacterium]|nr:enoyl-CoA hydratase/isomerase family protein [bacterium]
MSDQDDILYKGPDGYVELAAAEHNGKRGALLRYINPDARKLHAVDEIGMLEMDHAIATVEELCARGAGQGIDFLVLYGAYDPLHAGADVTQFDGDPDYDAISAHLHRGVGLDARIKRLWHKLRTVGVMCGNRFGGSVEWPLFAQYGVCDSATVIQLSEVQLGILPGWNGVLNVMLRSNPSNGQYMATTGNAVNAEQMLASNLVQTMVAAPAAPDRRLTLETDWFAQWQAHAETAQQQLLVAALDLATGDDDIAAGSDYQLCDGEVYLAEIGRRTQETQYKELRQRIEEELLRLGGAPGADEVKALNKLVTGELALLGKPLAPEAVNFVQRYVKQIGALSRDELLARFEELGHIEAALCVELMHHAHRREGVRAVLSKNPAERIPVFTVVDYSDEVVSPYELVDGS